jgi:putative molybdopterin biosynthesis protein
MSLEDNWELWNMTEPIFYSLEKVADMLQVSERTVMREIKAGKIRAFKVGRSLRFTPEAVQEYVRQQEVKPGDGLEENAREPNTA